MDNTKSFIESCITKQHDFYMNPCEFKLIPISYDSHPKYLVDNQDKFSEYIRSL
jgi:hypothetical protein